LPYSCTHSIRLIRIGSPVVGHTTQFTQSGAQTWNLTSLKGQTCAGADTRAVSLRGILLAAGFNSISFCFAHLRRREPRSLCFSSSLFFSSASRDKSRILSISRALISRALSCMCLNSDHVIGGIPASRRSCVILLYASSSVSRRVVYCRGIDFAFGGNGSFLGPCGNLGNAFTMGIGGAARKKLCGPTRLEDSQLRAWASTRTGVWRTRGCNRAL
jgi:hypothetical protein